MSDQASAHSTIVAPSKPDDSQLLFQAGQLAGNLRERFREVERREHQLNEQLMSLDQEQRRARLLRQESADEVDSRVVTLKQREQQFAQQLANGQRLLGDLQAREEQLEQLTVELETARAGLRAEMERALEMERSTLGHSQSLVEAERRELAKQSERRQEEHQEALRQNRRELDAERRRLRAQMAGDVDTERNSLKREREQWQQQRELEQIEFEKHREAQKRAADRFELELAQETERSRVELSSTQQRLETELLERRAQFETDYKQWAEQSEAERSALAKLRADLEATRVELNTANDNQQQQYRAVFERLQDEHQRSLENQRTEFERELKRRKDAFSTEQIAHQRRLSEESQQHQMRLDEQRRAFQAQIEGQTERLSQARHAAQTEIDDLRTEQADEFARQQAEIEQQLLDLERAAIQNESTLEDRRRQLDADDAAARQETQQQLRLSWDKERAELRAQLANDIDSERAKLKEEIEAFDARQQRETNSLKRAKEVQESAINQARSEVVREKQHLNESLQEQRATQESHLHAARCQFEESLERRVDEVDSRIATEEKRITDLHAAYDQSVGESIEAISRERVDLEQARKEWLVEFEAMQQELKKQQRETQVERHVFYVQRQQWQQNVQQATAAQNLRQKQLQRFREILSERERSLAREQVLFEKSRQQAMLELKTDREQLDALRQQIEQDHVAFHTACETHRGEMRRERNRLAQRSERLDEMRKELEETSLQNLESRLAAEDVMAELVATAGDETARRRVAEVRTVIAGQIRELQASATPENRTAQLVAVAQRELAEEATRLKTEQKAFSESVSTRERNLASEELRLQALSQNWERREHQWRAMRDDWLKEKLNAEQIIRSLLDEITESIESPAASAA